MAGLLTLLRAGRWAPVALTFGSVAVLLGLVDDPAEAVGALVVAIPFGVVWLVDDAAATLTASARWGRRPQLAVRCALAVAVAFGGWAAAVAYAGSAPPYGTVVLAALLAAALASGITWGAAYGGPAAVVVWAATQLPPYDWGVAGREWWTVVVVAAGWLVVATRDPARS
ncbi:MAG TPA: hypothetical protein VNQ77_05675 [Frankiaceae bacterium]|nr:hypothetical protein [Frankiaceae bacterium]